ncbi:hypothetical protein CV102_02270 [Natronococcus pandeyae]|uniref:Uncharacterized protein n=1 Tax=Natronococcus pandeyae TaxID=2055836 RepID=A0A8J8TTL9_9EURY|nr:hypothetical protein [Natronococcus pandeyae]TYL40420.1 hypothetical protein CV102_02270 [Natronococcus pandeyae]
MFPPPFSSELILTDDMNPLTQAYHDVVIYGDADADDALYEGPVVVHANGWLELEGNRLLSPSAVHHIDIYDDESDELGSEPAGGDTDGSGDGDDDRRTGRFSPR